MKTAWRDPAFFAFLMAGLVLLAGSFVCRAQALGSHDAPTAMATVAKPLPRLNVQFGSAPVAPVRGSMLWSVDADRVSLTTSAPLTVSTELP